MGFEENAQWKLNLVLSDRWAENSVLFDTGCSQIDLLLRNHTQVRRQI